MAQTMGVHASKFGYSEVANAALLSAMTFLKQDSNMQESP